MAEELKPDICVIGGGPGGIAVAVAAANSGVPVVLVEKDKTGGTNLTRGGVPSKALLYAAAQHEYLRRGPAVGVTGAPLQVNFAKVQDHVQQVTDAVALNLAPARLAALGVTVIPGSARFVDKRTITVGDMAIRARRFVIATGAVPALPKIPGLDSIDTITAEAAYDMTRKPPHLLVVGADQRGLEIAQAYTRLGVDTTVIDTEPALAGTDPELSTILLDRLRAEGIRVRDAANITGIGRRRGGIRVVIGEGENEAMIDGSHIIVARGRSPNVAGLGLDAAGVVHDADGITVDRVLRTTNRRVYAVGDVVAGDASANRAAYQAHHVVRSILYRLPFREHSTAVPRVIFTDPGLAEVGINEADARRRYEANIIVVRFPFAENDLAQAERSPAGVIKLVATRRGRILGAGIVSADAGELISMFSLAIGNRFNVKDLQSFVPAYPSRAEAVQRTAQAFAGHGSVPRWRRRVIEFLRRFG